MAIAGLYKIFDHWHKQGTVHIISDPHFNDDELLALVPDHPIGEELVKSINAKVGRKDTLICLGDVGDIECVKKLRGYKVLICGNHDKGATTYQRQIYKKKFDDCIYTREEALAEMKRLYPGCVYDVYEECSFHAPFTSWQVEADNRLFDEVYEGPLMISEKLILSHEPVDVPWAFNLHGHDHTGRKSDERHFNVCADVIDYTPINFNQWMKEGYLSKVETIHRSTIDKATSKSKKRKGRKK